METNATMNTKANAVFSVPIDLNLDRPQQSEKDFESNFWIVWSSWLDCLSLIFWDSMAKLCIVSVLTSKGTWVSNKERSFYDQTPHKEVRWSWMLSLQRRNYHIFPPWKTYFCMKYHQNPLKLTQMKSVTTAPKIGLFCPNPYRTMRKKVPLLASLTKQQMKCSSYQSEYCWNILMLHNLEKLKRDAKTRWAKSYVVLSNP